MSPRKQLSIDDRLLILIAEDNNTDRLILKAIIEYLGHQTITATDGEQAVHMFQQHQPDIVLLDAMMPLKSGMEAAQEIRRLADGAWLPILFLTSLNKPQDLAACLDAGGDDFISKPYNPVIITAKLNAYVRSRKLHEEVKSQRENLLQEQQMAKAVFDNIAHFGVLNAPNIRYRISPMSLFNGDVLLAAIQPNTDMLVLLGDFTGHGLPAAIGTLPMANIFHGMAKKGFSLEHILREINHKLKRILPRGVFCCATAMHLSFRDRSIEVWAGGMPEGLMFNTRTGLIKEISSNHLPLAILSADEFKFEPLRWEMDADDRLFLWSDGVVEAMNSNGEFFGEERLRACFSETENRDAVFDEVLNRLETFVGQQHTHDDYTLVEVGVLSEESLQHLITKDKSWSVATGPKQWAFEYSLEAESLKQFDPIPMLTHILLQVPGLRKRIGQINTILNELYTNALEHGVLGLESSIKSNPEGFHRYYQMRDERLRKLKNGFIKVNASHEPLDNGGLLRLRFTDSGKGFDYQVHQNDAQSPVFYGRGLMLVSSLCRHVEYGGAGNEVMVEFAWQQGDKDE